MGLGSARAARETRVKGEVGETAPVAAKRHATTLAPTHRARRARGRRDGVEKAYDSPVGSPVGEHSGWRDYRRQRKRAGERSRGVGAVRDESRDGAPTLGGSHGGVCDGLKSVACGDVAMRGSVSLSALPRDVVLHACSFMDVRTVEALASTSKSFRAMTMQDDGLWKTLYEKRWRWRPGRVWARSAQLPFESSRATAATRPDIFRGGRGWREAFKTRYSTRGIGAERRVHHVNCVGGTMSSDVLQKVLNTTRSGDVVELSPGTYKGGVSIPPGVELVGCGAREEIIIVSDDKAALKTKTKVKHGASPSLVTNITLFRQSATSRGTLSGDTHQACVYVSKGTTLRLDSCDIISAGEGVAATSTDCVVHVHASNIHSVLSSFLSGAGSSLTACRITAATSVVDESSSEGSSEDELDAMNPSGFAHLFAAVTALSGEVRIVNNRIVNGFAHGVVLFNSAHGQIHDNLIANNIGAGISVGASSTANITNTIVANNASVGIAMCGRGVISHSDIQGNMFNGIDVSQRYTTRDYFNAHEDEIDEDRDVEEEFSAFLLGVDEQYDVDSTSPVKHDSDVTISACVVHDNANDGVCVTGGAKVNLVNGCELFANAASDLAVDRGRVRWDRGLSIAGRRVDRFTNDDNDDENRVNTVRVLGSQSSVTPTLFGVLRSRSAMSIVPPSVQRFAVSSA